MEELSLWPELETFPARHLKDSYALQPKGRFSAAPGKGPSTPDHGPLLRMWLLWFKGHCQLMRQVHAVRMVGSHRFRVNVEWIKEHQRDAALFPITCSYCWSWRAFLPQRYKAFLTLALNEAHKLRKVFSLLPLPLSHTHSLLFRKLPCWFFFLLHLYIWERVHVPQGLCGGQRNLQQLVSAFYHVGTGDKPKRSVLAASTFIC